MKYDVCLMIPYSFSIDAEDDEDFKTQLEYEIPAEFGGDSIWVQCEDGREWEEN